jgi:general secretion pathway protein A
MYTEYWQLTKKPFENAPDPEFFYPSPEHEEAYIRMLYALKENKGAALLTGEYGSGKTLLVRVLVNELEEEKNEIVFLNNPRWAPAELYSDILYQLEEDVSDKSQSGLIRALGEIFYRNFTEGKNTLIVIDEAQLIRDESVFEELRLLLNFQLNDRFLLTLFLVGQPELRERVMEIPQLEQRLSIKFHLHNMDPESSFDYISHRLRVAGREKNMFTREAMDFIHRSSHGTPRRINNICDMCLLTGFGKKLDEIDLDIAKSVI